MFILTKKYPKHTKKGKIILIRKSVKILTDVEGITDMPDRVTEEKIP